MVGYRTRLMERLTNKINGKINERLMLKNEREARLNVHSCLFDKLQYTHTIRY